MPSAGDVVRLSRGGKTLRIGAVDAVMPDQGFWLSANGLDTRVFVTPGDAELEIWTKTVSPSGSAAQP